LRWVDERAARELWRQPGPHCRERRRLARRAKVRARVRARVRVRVRVRVRARVRVRVRVRVRARVGPRAASPGRRAYAAGYPRPRRASG
jgi:hypothetical protein